MTLPCYRYVPRRRLNFKAIKNNSVYQCKCSKFFKLSKDAILGNYVNAVTYGNLDSSINEAIGIGWVDGSVSTESHNLVQNEIPFN
jgi:hypothetical protein